MKKIMLFLIIGIFMITSVSAAWTDVLTENLIRYYNFDEGTGTTAEDLVNIDDWTVTDTWQTTDCIKGGCFFFNKTSMNQTGTRLNNTGGVGGAVSFNFWLLLNGSRPPGLGEFVFGTQGDSTFDTGEFRIGFIGVDSKLSLKVRDGTPTTNTIEMDNEIPIGNWTMITVSMNNSGYSFYTNGTFEESAFVNYAGVDLSWGINPIQLSSDGSGVLQLKNASIDELAFWNRTLISSERVRLYNGGSGITYVVYFTINSETYSANVLESSQQDFSINITYNSSRWDSIVGNLQYNGTNYTATQTGIGDTIVFDSVISIPTLSGTTAETKFFNWVFTFTNSSTSINAVTNLNSQIVSPIILRFCNNTVNTSTLNFTLKEAGTFIELNGSLEATFNYWSSGDGSIYQTYSFANLSDNNTHFDFCVSPDDASFQTTATISYLKDGYDRREYLLSNYTINNITEEIDLFLTTTASTDIFTFTVRDENDDLVPGATIRVQRWDIGTNNFYTVGMIFTTSDGTGIINLRLNDAWYRYQVLYNDILYLTTDPVKESTTSRTLDINLAASNPYDQFGLIDFSLTYNEDTNITVFTYADTTGAVQIGCLKVFNITGTGNTEVYSSCVESTSGTLSYQILDSGTYLIRASFRLNAAYDNVEKVIDEIIIQGKATRFVTLGSFGQVISLLLTGTMAAIGIASGSIILGLGLIIASLVLENLMGWLNVTSTVLYGFISIVILIALNLKRKGG